MTMFSKLSLTIRCWNVDKSMYTGVHGVLSSQTHSKQESVFVVSVRMFFILFEYHQHLISFFFSFFFLLLFHQIKISRGYFDYEKSLLDCKIELLLFVRFDPSSTSSSSTHYFIFVIALSNRRSLDRPFSPLSHYFIERNSS